MVFLYLVQYWAGAPVVQNLKADNITQTLEQLHARMRPIDRYRTAYHDVGLRSRQPQYSFTSDAARHVSAAALYVD
jgi:hypothetical protein